MRGAAGIALAVVAVATAGLLLPSGLGGADPVGGVLPGAAPGVLPGDAASHVARAWLWATTLAAGETPTWSNAWYAGFPLHRYYGPGLPALTAAVARVLARGSLDAGDVTRAAAAIAWAGGVAGAASAGRLARPGTARVVAVGVMGLAPLGLAGVTQAGLLPLALVHPLAALAVGGAVHGGRRGTAAAALGVAGVLTAHVQYGVLLALVLPVVALLGPRPPSRRAALAGGVLLVALSAWLVLPGIALRDAAVLGADPWTEPLWDPEATPANWLALVRWAREGDGWIVHYAGLSVLALAAVGARDRAVRAHAALVAVAVVAAAAQPRLLHLALPSLAVLAGEGVAALSPRARVVAVLALALDLGSTVAPVRWRPLPALPVAGRTVVLADGRATWWRGADALDTGATALLGGLPQAATPALATLAGAVAAATREADPSPATWEALRAAGVDTLVDARAAVPTARPVPAAARAFFATVALPADPLPLPDWRTLRDGVADGSPPRASPPGPARPFPASEAPSGVSEPPQTGAPPRLPSPDANKVASSNAREDAAVRSGSAPLLPLDLVDLDPAAPIARAVVLAEPGDGRATRCSFTRGFPGSADAPPPLPPPAATPASPATFTLLDATETPATVTARYRSDRDGWLRLATAAFPCHRATVDGAPARWAPTDAGFVAVAIPAGEHAVRVESGLLPGEPALLLVGAAATVLAAGLTLVRERPYRS